LELLTTAHPEHPELDMELTGTLLSTVARGDAPDTIRVFRPGPTVAFGRLDRARPGFEDARVVAARHGRTPVLRWGGGHAAAYDSECVIVEVLVRHDRGGISGLQTRFLAMAETIQRVFDGLDVPLELGELPGEYCPGRYSLHIPAGPKVAGVAQRVLARASLTTAVVVVGGGEELRTVIRDVYAALDLPLDVATAGAVTDHYPNINASLVQRAIIEARPALSVPTLRHD